MTEPEQDEGERRRRLREDRSDRRELIETIALLTGMLALLVTAVTLTFFVFTHLSSITGIVFTLLTWAFFAASGITVVYVGSKVLDVFIDQYIDKNSPVVAAVVAAAAGVFAGAATDLVDAGTVKAGLAMGFALLGLLFGGLYPKNKIVAISVLSLVPATVALIFFAKSPADRSVWLDKQGIGGLVSVILIVVMLAVALLIAAYLDDQKSGGNSWMFHGIARLRDKLSRRGAVTEGE
jgi:hypothetical protein